MKRSYRTLLLSVHRPSGRRVLLTQLCLDGWPVLKRLARLYRRLFLRDVCIVAVVGSLGKTTTTRAVRQALGISPSDQYPGNAKSYIALNILRLRPKRKFAVLEVGVAAPGLMVSYAAMIQPDVVVVTSIGSEHHRSFGTLGVTRHEKAEMVRALSSDGLAVLNADDPNALWMAGETTARVITFGTSEGADFRAGPTSLEWPSGSRFQVNVDGTAWAVKTQLVGDHMVYPILAAMAVAMASGVSLSDCVSRLADLPPAPMRLDRVRLPNGSVLIRDERKSTQETISAAFRLFSQVPAKRRFLVLGDVSEPVGSQGDVYRGLGRHFSEFAAEVFLVGHGSCKYRPGARAAGFDMARVHNMKTNLRATVECLRDRLSEGDVVLIKGRDTERLERIALSLIGRDVRCLRRFCNLPHRCENCALLEGGRSAF